MVGKVHSKQVEKDNKLFIKVNIIWGILRINTNILYLRNKFKISKIWIKNLFK